MEYVLRQPLCSSLSSSALIFPLVFLFQGIICSFCSSLHHTELLPEFHHSAIPSLCHTLFCPWPWSVFCIYHADKQKGKQKLCLNVFNWHFTHLHWWRENATLFLFNQLLCLASLLSFSQFRPKNLIEPWLFLLDVGTNCFRKVEVLEYQCVQWILSSSSSFVSFPSQIFEV